MERMNEWFDGDDDDDDQLISKDEKLNVRKGRIYVYNISTLYSGSFGRT